MMTLQIIQQQEQDFIVEQNFNQQAQTIAVSTIVQINELSQSVVSQLAQQLQTNFMGDYKTEVSQHLDKFQQTKQENLKTIVQETLSLLLEVKFHLTLVLQLYLNDKSHNQAIKQIQQDIKKFRKIILLLESQMSMILWILQNRKKLHFKEKYYQKFNQLQQFAINIDHIDDGYLNIKMIIEALEAVKQILHQYIISIMELKQSIEKNRRSKYLLRGLNRLVVINAKMLTISEVVPYCCTVEKQDLFSYQMDHPRWTKLISQCVIFKSFADRQTLKLSFDNFKKYLNLVNATMGILDKTRKLPLSNFTSWFHIARSSKYIMKLILFRDAAKKQAQYMISSANTQLMKQVWNLPQHKVFRDFAQFVLPSIQHSERLYIPRICKQYFNSNGQSPLPQELTIFYLNQYGNQLFQKRKYSQRLRIRINSKYKLTPKFRIIDQKIKKLSQGTGIIVKKIENTILNIASLCGYKLKYTPDKLIFHIHGGGFISMSSFIHQVYTRTWSKQLEVPIISVDYGKAPQHPYPEGLYDCLEAYMWTLYSYQQIYQASPKQIIFLGDSAGGNLAASLINLCIAWKLRVPDGLVMCYPVLSVTTKKYTKSLLGTLEDMILPHTLLKLCESSYAKSRQVENDPLISPLYTPNQFLQKYPPTQIFVGSRDPFYDDCFRFTQRMNNVNPGKCFLTIFQEFPHGFLQFDLKTHPNQYGRQANSLICQKIRKMFQNIENKQK